MVYSNYNEVWGFKSNHEEKKNIEKYESYINDKINEIKSSIPIEEFNNNIENMKNEINNLNKIIYLQQVEIEKFSISLNNLKFILYFDNFMKKINSYIIKNRKNFQIVGIILFFIISFLLIKPSDSLLKKLQKNYVLIPRNNDLSYFNPNLL